ncbi:VOC family protein [Corynebacterium sp. CCM 9204]|uniref:VOC family protein n=1 Tax=Corynebacterium sp. CCM 9204 TaxID=3057616 RepID=UPI003525B445
MPAFMAQDGMPFWIDLTTSEMRKTAHFYAEILGWDVEEAAPGYRLARAQGLPVAGFIEQPQEATQPDTWITYFLTGDISSTVARTRELGGTVLTEPFEVHLGQVAILVDSAGAMFGVIEPSGEERFVSGGEPGTSVWHELTATSGYDRAVDFYTELFGWTVRRLDEDGARYTLIDVDGSPFAGVWDAEGTFPPQVPGFWQTYLGVKDIAATAEKVTELGGEIIRGPFDAEFGTMLIIADSTGATLTLCEADEPMEEGNEADPLQGIDLSQFDS